MTTSDDLPLASREDVQYQPGAGMARSDGDSFGSDYEPSSAAAEREWALSVLSNRDASPLDRASARGYLPHWHWATGIPGYGPDGSDGFNTAVGTLELADGLRDELRSLSEFVYEGAQCSADAGEFERAWYERKRSDEFEVLRANLNPERASAPAYRDDPAAFERDLLRIVAETFPLDVSDSLRLYVWECSVRECEHCAEE